MVSKPSYLKQGPPIEVTVSIYENAISEVSLALRNQPGLVWQIYRNLSQTWNLDCAKAPGLDDRKSVHISNIDRLMIVQPRELSHRTKSKFETGCGIINEQVQSKLFDEISRWFEGYCLKKQDLLLPPLALSYCRSFTRQVLEFIKKNSLRVLAIIWGSSIQDRVSKSSESCGGSFRSQPLSAFTPLSPHLGGRRQVRRIFLWNRD